LETPRTIELELVRRCQRGEPDAFDGLYDKFGDVVWRLCYRMAGNSDDAQDLAQEVWLTVWQRIGGFRCESAFATWLYRVTSNVCLQWLRKVRNKKTSPIDDIPLVSPERLESEVADREYVNRLLAAVKELPEPLKLALTLRVERDLSYGEIAEALDCTTAAAKMRVSRARAMLAEAFGEDET
jgi:RNA polymerase sigma-70 factor (ECF subfamily)